MSSRPNDPIRHPRPARKSAHVQNAAVKFATTTAAVFVLHLGCDIHVPAGPALAAVRRPPFARPLTSQKAALAIPFGVTLAMILHKTSILHILRLIIHTLAQTAPAKNEPQIIHATRLLARE
jgi:hypothetical protein